MPNKTLREMKIQRIQGVWQAKPRLWLVVIENDQGRQYVGKAPDFDAAVNECLSRMNGGLKPSNNKTKAY